MFYRMMFLSLFATLNLFAQESANEKTEISETFGHLIGKNLKSLGLDLDMELVFKGMQDQANGKDAPLTEDQCRQAVFTRQSTKNLNAAETFLKENAKNTEIVSLEEGKVQYKIEKKGEGTKVDSSDSPLIRYVGNI
jgi:peptidylprolyl isomerase